MRPGCMLASSVDVSLRCGLGGASRERAPSCDRYLRRLCSKHKWGSSWDRACSSGSEVDSIPRTSSALAMAKPMPRSRAIRVLGVALVVLTAVPILLILAVSAAALSSSKVSTSCHRAKGVCDRQWLGPLQVPRAARQPPAPRDDDLQLPLCPVFRAVQVHLPPRARRAVCASHARGPVVCYVASAVSSLRQPAPGTLLQGGREKYAPTSAVRPTRSVSGRSDRRSRSAYPVALRAARAAAG